jgi:hypothetical protein
MGFNSQTFLRLLVEGKVIQLDKLGFTQMNLLVMSIRNVEAVYRLLVLRAELVPCISQADQSTVLFSRSKEVNRVIFAIEGLMHGKADRGVILNTGKPHLRLPGFSHNCVKEVQVVVDALGRTAKADVAHCKHWAPGLKGRENFSAN